MNFDRVSSGTPIREAPTTQAAWINAVSESAEYYQQQIRLGKGPNAVAGSLQPVKVRNTTGGDLLRGSVVELGDELLDAKDPRNLWFEGNTYSDGVLAILCQAAPDEKIVPAKLVGPVVALVNVTSTSHTHAAPASSETVLQSGTEGIAQILSSLDETGEQECIVLIGAGGSGGGSTARTGRIYEDLDGAAVDATGKFTSPDVSFAYEIADGDGWVADTATGLGTAKILFGVSVDVDSTGCCGEEAGTSLFDPLYIENIGYVGQDDSPDALVISGGGAGPTASLYVVVYNQSGNYINVHHVSNPLVADASGNWVADPVDLTGDHDGAAPFTRGILRVGVSQKKLTDIAFGPPRYIGFSYETTASPTPVIYDAPDSPPDLLEDDDDGDNKTNNITSEDLPTFQMTRPAGTPLGSYDPYPVLLVDGLIKASGTNSDLDDGSVDLTVGTPALTENQHNAQWLMYSQDLGATPSGNYYGGVSESLQFIVNEDSADLEEELDSRRWFRRVKIETVNSETTITQIDNCRSELLDEDEISMVDGE